MHELNKDFEMYSPSYAGPLMQRETEHSSSDGASIRFLPKRNFKVEIHDAFGPDPDWVLRCFVDLGLSDGEIARYVGLSEACINILVRPLRGPDLGKYLS